MYVGVLKLGLMAPHCHSLKEKRAVVRGLVDRVRAREGVELKEVGGQDTWQRIVLGAAVVAGEHRHAADRIERVVALIDSMGLARVASDRREVIAIDDSDEPGHSPGDSLDGWVPEAWADAMGDGGEEE